MASRRALVLRRHWHLLFIKAPPSRFSYTIPATSESRVGTDSDRAAWDPTDPPKGRSIMMATSDGDGRMIDSLSGALPHCESDSHR
jgi:hypothetical protein